MRERRVRARRMRASRASASDSEGEARLRSMLDRERRLEILERWQRREDRGLTFAAILLAAGLAWVLFGGPPPDPALLAAAALAAALLPLLPLGYPRREDGRLALRLDRALGSRELLATWLELEDAARRADPSPFLALVRRDARRLASLRAAEGDPHRLAPHRTAALAILTLALGAAAIPAARAARAERASQRLTLEALLEEALRGLAASTGTQAAPLHGARELLEEALASPAGSVARTEALGQARQAIERALQALEAGGAPRRAMATPASGDGGEPGPGDDPRARLREISTKVRAALRLDATEREARQASRARGSRGTPGGGASAPPATRGDHAEPAGGRSAGGLTTEAPSGTQGSPPRAGGSERVAGNSPPPFLPRPFAPEDERLLRAYFASPRDAPGRKPR